MQPSVTLQELCLCVSVLNEMINMNAKKLENMLNEMIYCQNDTTNMSAEEKITLGMNIAKIIGFTKWHACSHDIVFKLKIDQNLGVFGFHCKSLP